jgi:hypothetical protein
VRHALVGQRPYDHLGARHCQCHRRLHGEWRQPRAGSPRQART